MELLRKMSPALVMLIPPFQKPLKKLAWPYTTNLFTCELQFEKPYFKMQSKACVFVPI